MSGFERAEVSWAVEYDDGSILAQYDKREQDNLEVPLSTIEWARVKRVMFESQNMTYSYTLPILEPELKWSMRIRHFLVFGPNVEILVMILLASMKDAEVSDDSVVFALYVSPDGIIHFCDQFNCTHIPNYYHGQLNKVDITVPQMSWRTETKASALLQEPSEDN